jgi:hypothetical protein
MWSGSGGREKGRKEVRQLRRSEGSEVAFIFPPESQ